MKKQLLSFVFFAIISTITYAQNTLPNKVEGLELPAKISVPTEQKTVVVQAKCSGLVKWVVTSKENTKYTIDEQTNKITINLPSSGEMNVLAIGILNGKVTEFASTQISVMPKKEIKIPNEQLPKVTMFLNYAKLTSEELKIINNQYTNLYTKYRCYDINSPILETEKYMGIAKTPNQESLMVIEGTDGKVLWSGPVPKTEKEVAEIIKTHLVN